MNILLHTPEGVRDIYNSDCAVKLHIQNKIHELVKSYGYHDVEGPSFEFFDIFNKERGSIASKEMYKFFDKEGNTLVLRPDMTPQIARIAAKYYENEEAPIKLCYQGRKFVNGSSYQGRLKETTQLGAELIGDSSVDSDAEVIVMLAESLLAAGLTDFQVEIGHINYFRGLVNQAGLDEETENEILEMIQNKNYFGLEELISRHHIEKSVADVFLRLPQMFGSIDILREAGSLTDNFMAKQAICHLEKLHEILKIFGVEKYVTYDLGMVNKLRYYTGVMFQAFTYGTGEFIAGGGRYDKLIGQFGKSKPSIGFSITIDYLMIALSRQKITVETDDRQSFMVLFTEHNRNVAIRLSRLYRSKKVNVNMMVFNPLKDTEFYLDYAQKHGIGHVITVLEDETIEMIQVLTKNVKREKLSSIFE